MSAKHPLPKSPASFFRCLLLVWLSIFFFIGTVSAATSATMPVWRDTDASGQTQVHLYFFWSQTCPHCLSARPFVEALPGRYPWLRLHSQEVSAQPEAVNAYMAMAESLGETASSVPAFLFCGQMTTGFDSPETTGRALEEALLACRQSDASENTVNSAVDREKTANMLAPAITLPGLGPLDLDQLSLPLLTLVIAGLDAFNPCAFFILLFLLSLLVHAGSRLRMLYIGGLFLSFSGLIYFLFMAAWLNVFRWLGELAIVTTLAGGVALLIALINIKDYFWFKRGVSLSIPDTAKPGLFRRMRQLLQADSLFAMTIGTVVLAVVANTYELLCTAGFPMVYTRLLTLAKLDPWAYYLWLGIYNLIYVTPLLAITLVFTFTLGARKLTEHEGRLLKLLSGLMMLQLGILLVFFPNALNNLGVALGLLAGSLLVTYLVHRWQRGGRPGG